MKIISVPILSTALLMLMTFSTSVYAADEKLETTADVGVQYKTHIQDKGWESNWVGDGNISGTIGESKRLEGLKVQLYGSIPANANIQTYVHVQNKGDLGPFTMGSLAGTEGQGLRLESIRLVLNNMPGYILKYNVQVQNKGWLRDEDDSSTWFSSGSTAGTAGEGLRLEGIRIELVEINEELEAYYAALNAVSEYDYTIDSWADYQGIVDDNVVDASNTKAEIIAATKSIIAAQGNLVKGKVMSGYVNALKGVNEADYTPETWETYQLVVIDNVVTQDNSQSEINKATLNILTAQKFLQHKVNLTEYSQALAAVRETDYTTASWAVYKSVLAANTMTEANTQVEVDAAVKKIKLAQYKMVREFDFTAYNALLAAAKEEAYIESSWVIYKEVVDANVVDENDTQTDVEEAIKKIEAAQKQLIKKADLKYYQAALDAVKKEDYTTTSWNAYLKEISSIVVNPTSQQEVVDAATQKIIEAQRKLVPAGDMTYYKELLAAVTQSDCTAASWTVYQKVVDANVVIATDGQQAINDAILKIEAAQKKLVKGAQDFVTYNALIKLNPDLYTSVSWAVYQKIIDANYVVPADGQEKVNAAVTKLSDAKRKLVERAKDFTQYNKALKYNLYLGGDPDDKAATKVPMQMKEIEYTTSSWATYQKVLDTNAMDGDKSQAQVNTAVANIKKAQFKLLKGGSLSRYYTVLKYNIDLGKDPDDSTDTKALKEMKETDYTSTSWTVYQKVLTTNEMDRDKSQAQIDAAVVKIEQAQTKLVVRGVLDEYYGVLNLVKKANYTTKSWTEYEKKLASKGYFVTPDNSQAEINRAIDLIELAQLNLQPRGNTDEYYSLIDKYTDQSVFKTKPWSTYLSDLAKNVVTVENTDAEIKVAIDAIKRAQDRLILPENAASILTAYNEALTKTDSSSSYTPTSWKTYQDKIKAYLGYTKDTDQLKVNSATEAIILAQQSLSRTNQNELNAFQNVIEMYLRNKMQVGKNDLKPLNIYANSATWKKYTDTVEKYAAAYVDYTWQQTVINKDSRPEVIVTATEDIKKAIRQLQPDGINLELDYTDYNLAVKNAKPWRDDLEIWSQTMAQVAPIYTQKSYDDYVKACNGYEIINRIESTTGVLRDQVSVSNATASINNAQQPTTLYLRAVESDIAAYNYEVTQFKTLKSASGNYTEATWKNYETIYLASPANLNDLPNLKQSDCQNGTAQLAAARQGLKYTAKYVGSKLTKNDLQLPSVSTGTDLLERAKSLLVDNTKYKVEVSGTPVGANSTGTVTALKDSTVTISFTVTEIADPTNYITIPITGISVS